MTKSNSMAWIIGYFIILAPLNYTLSWGLQWALTHSIIGLIGAILFLRMGQR